MTINAGDHGYAAWSFDPVYAQGAHTMVDGVVSLVGIDVLAPVYVSTIHLAVTTAGATIANCFAGIYDLAGNRLGLTADLATPWASTGNKAHALTATVLLQAGWHYIALLEGSGTTDVQFARAGNTGGSALGNVNMAAPKLRQAASGAGLTSLPSTITTSTLLGTTGAPVWVAVS